MDNEKVFCEICREDVSYKTKKKNMVGVIRGKKYHYLGEEARCVKCGHYVDVENVSQRNLDSLYSVYREENDIISLDKLRQIVKNYAIGKRPLSLLLGWGEHTYTRYYEGDIPTRQYSDILSRLFEEPSYYLEILDKNKSLISKSTYFKSKKAVERLLFEENTSKIVDVIHYLLNQCEDITPLALQKSLYYIQGFYYAFFGNFLFEEDCEAWAHGPVYKDIYIKYANYHFDPIAKVEKFDSSIFSTNEMIILNSVIRNICCYSGKILEKFTHNESPWLITRGDLTDGAPSNRIIEKSLIADYFLEVKNNYKMSTPKDIQLYTKDLFLSII